MIAVRLRTVRDGMVAEGVSSLNRKLLRNISLLPFASFCTHKSTRELTQISGGQRRTSTNHHLSRWRDLVSVIELWTVRFETIFFGKAKCVDDHFLCLLRLLIMSVLKPKDIGEYIHVEGFEFVSQFFQGHSLLRLTDIQSSRHVRFTPRRRTFAVH